MPTFISTLLMISFAFSALGADEDNLVVIPKNRAEKTKFQEIPEKMAISYLNTKAQTSQAFTKKDFSILVWNVFKGVKKDLFKEFPKLAPKYDLLILQEAYTIPEMLKMFEATPHYYTMAGSFIYKPLQVTTGVATGSLVKATKEIPLQSKYKEPIVDATQMCLASEYSIANSNEKLLVVNVHAIVFVPSDHLFHQLDQFKSVVEKHKGPVILAGDFNTWDEMKLKYLMRMVKHLKLSSIEYAPDIRRKFKNYPLDHLFYRGLKLRYARVMQMTSSSDHNPIEAGFTLP